MEDGIGALQESGAAGRFLLSVLVEVAVRTGGGGHCGLCWLLYGRMDGWVGGLCFVFVVLCKWRRVMVVLGLCYLCEVWTEAFVNLHREMLL